MGVNSRDRILIDSLLTTIMAVRLDESSTVSYVCSIDISLVDDEESVTSAISAVPMVEMIEYI
jgi:hypothetical protein